jgi:hypothetical protein
MRWLLDHAAAGAALTTTGNLARSLVAEGCRLFGWLTITGNPRSESDIVELWTLRDWARQMGVVRRSGRRLVLSTTGGSVHADGTPAVWRSTMDNLLGPEDADTGDHTAGLLGNLRRRLRLLALTTQERLGQPARLTPTGHAAARTALRARALRPRSHPTTEATAIMLPRQVHNRPRRCDTNAAGLAWDHDCRREPCRRRMFLMLERLIPDGDNPRETMTWTDAEPRPCAGARSCRPLARGARSIQDGQMTRRCVRCGMGTTQFADLRRCG